MARSTGRVHLPLHNRQPRAVIPVMLVAHAPTDSASSFRFKLHMGSRIS